MRRAPPPPPPSRPKPPVPHHPQQQQQQTSAKEVLPSVPLVARWVVAADDADEASTAETAPIALPPPPVSSAPPPPVSAAPPPPAAAAPPPPATEAPVAPSRPRSHAILLDAPPPQLQQLDIGPPSEAKAPPPMPPPPLLTAERSAPAMPTAAAAAAAAVKPRTAVSATQLRVRPAVPLRTLPQRPAHPLPPPPPGKAEESSSSAPTSLQTAAKKEESAGTPPQAKEEEDAAPKQLLQHQHQRSPSVPVSPIRPEPASASPLSSEADGESDQDISERGSKPQRPRRSLSTSFSVVIPEELRREASEAAAGESLSAREPAPEPSPSPLSDGDHSAEARSQTGEESSASDTSGGKLNQSAPVTAAENAARPASASVSAGSRPSARRAATGLKFRTLTKRLLQRAPEQGEFVISGPTNFRKYEVLVDGGALHSRLVDDQGHEVKAPDPPPAPSPAQPRSESGEDFGRSLAALASRITKRSQASVDLSLKPQPPPLAALRQDIEALLEQMKAMDAIPWGNPELVDFWSSRPLPLEQWTDVDPEMLSLVDVAVKERGYHLEVNSKSVTHENPDVGGVQVINFDDDFPYYKEFFSVTAHEVYASLEGPCIVTLLRSGHGVYKAIVRVKKEDRRVLLPIEGWQKALKAFIPALKDLKFTRIKSLEIVAELVDYERKEIMTRQNFKFGVVYCRPNQRCEDALFGEEGGSPAYDEFLEVIGDRIELQGWSKYRGGLDVRSNNTGTHSVYTTYRGHEIMYHVATLLPLVKSDTQKVERKRHIGNDVSVVVFKDQADADDSFDPRIFTSHFIHCVFVVVAEKDESGATTHYRLTIANKPGVPPYPPFLPDQPRFAKAELREFLLPKLINAQRAAMASPEFNSLLTARREKISLICKTFLE